MTVSTTLALRRQAKATLTASWRPTIGHTLLGVRDSQATEKKDKIWAFAGMTPHDYNLASEIHYKTLSWRVMYIRATHFMLQKSLLVLLWLESPCGRMEDSTLPSWVPDYTQRQTYVSLAMVSTSQLFNADKGFPYINRDPSSTLECA